jgi:ribose transport system ATP-binding protein
VSRRALRRRTLELLEQLEAPELDPDIRVHTLSTAQHAVAELVRALASEPRVLVMDEATATLPPTEAEWALGLARRVASRGSIVIFISHRIAEIRQVADVVSVLRNGARVLEREAGAVSDDEMIEAMLGRKPALLYPSASVPPRDTVAMSVSELSVPDKVHDVSFDVREGEIVGLAGLEGHGQADLLLAMFGLVQSRGEVRVAGERVSVRSPRGAMSDGLALIPEDRRRHGLLLPKTIRENVTLATLPQVSRLGFISRKAEAVATAEAIRDLEIKCRSAEDSVTSLSGGNQQKVLIAKLLRVQAQVLLLHDLTRGVDVGTKAEIFALIREVAASGRGILFYSTDSQELVHMCDRILVMRRGRIVASLTGSERTEARIMQAAFGVGAEHG